MRPNLSQPGVALVVLKRVFNSPWLVAVLVLALYGLWLVFTFRAGADPRDFIIPGRNIISASQASSLIKIDPNYRYEPNNIGYDGQFYYYIALDPAKARYYLDIPAYRLTRVLYPVLARLLSFNQLDWIPYTMILLNWLGLGGGTLAVAAWLERKRISPWLALVYGLYPGFFISLRRDLTEILSCGLAALAVYLFDFGGKRSLFWSALVFGLAILARETVAVFAIVYAFKVLDLRLSDKNTSFTEKVRTALFRPQLWWFVGLAFIPFGLWESFLWVYTGALGLGAAQQLMLVPFQGLFKYYPWGEMQIEQIRTVVFPALICLGMGIYAGWRRAWRAEVWLLVLNIWLYVISLAPASYEDIYSSLRIAAGVVLAAIYCLPLFDGLTGTRRSWFYASAALWLSLTPFWLISPVVSNLLGLLK